MAVKQPFSEEESEPLKTASFPRDSEVPLDPVLCGGEVHNEALLHGICQVLDDTQVSLCVAATPYIKCLKDKDLSKKMGPGSSLLPTPHNPSKALGGLPKYVSSAVSSQVSVSRNLLDELHLLRPQAPQVQHVETINILSPFPTKFLSCLFLF